MPSDAALRRARPERPRAWARCLPRPIPARRPLPTAPTIPPLRGTLCSSRTSAARSRAWRTAPPPWAAHNAESGSPRRVLRPRRGPPEANGWYARDARTPARPCTSAVSSGCTATRASATRATAPARGTSAPPRPPRTRTATYKAPARDCCEADAMLPHRTRALDRVPRTLRAVPSSVSRVDDARDPWVHRRPRRGPPPTARTSDGSFAAAPLFKQLDEARPDGFGAHPTAPAPERRRRWYVAEKDTLDIDQGDKYYADSDADLPPTDPSAWRVARSGAPGAADEPCSRGRMISSTDGSGRSTPREKKTREDQERAHDRDVGGG